MRTNAPLEALRRAVDRCIAEGAPVYVNRLRCVDCSTEFDDTGKASRGYPPLCDACFTARLAEGR